LAFGVRARKGGRVGRSFGAALFWRARRSSSSAGGLHYGGQVGTEAKQTKMRPALLTGVLPKHADLLAFAFELKDAKVVELPARRQHGYEVF
jgi:hypothetical protein